MKWKVKILSKRTNLKMKHLDLEIKADESVCTK
jgi:hypothetical protein